MKRLLAGSGALALVLLAPPCISSRAQILAQAPTGAAKSQAPFTYDVSREVTITGKVSSVLAKPSTGMIMGSHLLIVTSNGLVDASLGRFGLRGDGAPSVTAGQRVKVTGVMRTIKDKPVLWTRIVKVDGQSYTIRNQHGFPLSAQSRKRTNPKIAGGAL
jgi:hypothetical protein